MNFVHRLPQPGVSSLAQPQVQKFVGRMGALELQAQACCPSIMCDLYSFGTMTIRSFGPPSWYVGGPNTNPT